MSNQYGPRIVTDGLVLCLDAGNNKSYPGSGNTWFDLSGNGNHATLTNGPTFNTDNKGSISFDGSNDYTSFAHPGTNGSIQLNFYWNDLRGNRLLMGELTTGKSMIYTGTSYNPTTYYLIWYPSSIDYSFNYIIPSNVAQWMNIALSWEGTSNNKMYINGVLVQSAVATINKPSTWYVAGGPYYNPQIIRVSNILTYNRILSANEIAQNYAATKGRFGL